MNLKEGEKSFVNAIFNLHCLVDHYLHEIALDLSLTVYVRLLKQIGLMNLENRFLAAGHQPAAALGNTFHLLILLCTVL